MTVSFFPLFNKRLNSTKRPVMDPDPSPDVKVDFDCKLKENCSEHDPVLMLATDNLSYAYAYISDWSKYYFVTDAISVHKGLAEYHLTEDVLATYKTAIGNTTARIIYAYANTRPDKFLVDPRIQIKNSRQIDRSAGSAVFGASKGYIVSVYADEASMSSSGFSVSYLLSQNGMDKMRDWFGMSNAAAAFRQYFNGTPLQSVFQCKIVPYYNELVANSDLAAYTNYMYIANRSSHDDGVEWTVSTPPDLCILKNRPILSGYHDFNTGLGYSDFRKYEPYTKSFIYLPGIGSIQLSRNEITTSKLRVMYDIDAITGDIKYTLWDLEQIGGIWTTKTLISEFNGNVASDCPLGQMVSNSQGVMTSIGATVGGAVSLAGAIAATVATEGGAAPMIAGAAASMIAGVANTVLSFNQHTPSITGHNSSILAQEQRYINYYEISVDTEDPTAAGYVATHGYPYAGTTQINSFSGYVQCEGASVAAYANNNELETINNYLNSGFYYE